MAERNNPRKAQREAQAFFEKCYEERRWNALSPEEQQAELEEKERKRLIREEEKRIETEKQDKLFNKYMKMANTITIEDFFKSEGPMEARVKVFCSIRGFTYLQTIRTMNEAERMYRKTRWRSGAYTREEAVEHMEDLFREMFRPRFTRR